MFGLNWLGVQDNYVVVLLWLRLRFQVFNILMVCKVHEPNRVVVKITIVVKVGCDHFVEFRFQFKWIVKFQREQFEVAIVDCQRGNR